jgi:hypothetical protein
MYTMHTPAAADPRRAPAQGRVRIYYSNTIPEYATQLSSASPLAHAHRTGLRLTILLAGRGASGGSRGLGLAMAKAFYEAGASVAIVRPRLPPGLAPGSRGRRAGLALPTFQTPPCFYMGNSYG